MSIVALVFERTVTLALKVSASNISSLLPVLFKHVLLLWPIAHHHEARSHKVRVLATDRTRVLPVVRQLLPSPFFDAVLAECVVTLI